MNKMGVVRVIFEFTNTAVYDDIVSSGNLLDPRVEQTSGALGNIRHFGPDPSINLYRTFFVSSDYEVPMEEGNFGPACVFGFGANSADDHGFILDRAFRILTPHFPKLPPSLSYSGAVICDYGHLVQDAYRELMEGVLSDFTS